MEKQAGEKLECPRTGVCKNDQELGASWLDFCVQETLLPGKPWHKVSDRLEAALAAEVKHQLKDSTRREIVFRLLGQSFVKRYFGSCPGDSDLPSFVCTSEKNKREEDAKTWLRDQCFKAAEHIHCQLSLDAKAPRPAPEMVHFLNDIYNIVVAETELLLATCKVWHKEKNAQDCGRYFQVSQLPVARNPPQPSTVFKRPKSIESKDIRLALLKTPAFQVNREDEHPYELAMYLHSLHQSLFPSWAEIHAMADSAMSFLEREDAPFFSHLRSSLRKNVTAGPKDFLVNPILQEQASTQRILASEERVQPSRPSIAKEVLANPVFFLRKWMGEGFVGVLNLPAVLLVWDQFFMQDWNVNVMQTFCSSILLLLKDSFMAADDYPAVREVFLVHPSRLLTADIQKAWIHLQQGGLPADIPGHNSLSQRDRTADLVGDPR